MYRWLLTLSFVLISVPTVSAQNKKMQIINNQDKGTLDFTIGGELVTRYHWQGYAKPIFHPVYAPGMIPLTRNYPPPEGQADDHPHQKSAWFCHGDVIPEGLDYKSPIKNVAGVDFWAEAKGHGKIVCTRVESIKYPKDHVIAYTKNEWRTPASQKIMDENRTIAMYDLGKARLIVVDIDLHASVCPITFADTKEGAFGIRINDVIHTRPATKGKAADKGKPATKDKPAGPGKVQNAEGAIGAQKCWGQISAWCDYSGPIDGKTVGLAILADPKNPHPSCWHVRDYGLMAANPFGREKHANFPAMKGNNELVKLAKGDHYKLRYAMVLHEGDAVTGDVAAAYKRFVELRKD